MVACCPAGSGRIRLLGEPLPEGLTWIFPWARTAAPTAFWQVLPARILPSTQSASLLCWLARTWGKCSAITWSI
jgi:hypothetical protein